jgi:hypothetical protein
MILPTLEAFQVAEMLGIPTLFFASKRQALIHLLSSVITFPPAALLFANRFAF